MTEMATLDDLRASLVEREIHAPDPSAFVLPAAARAPRPRVLAPALAAAAVVCVAAASIAVGRAVLHGGTQSPAASGGQPVTWSFSARPVPGFTITRDLYAVDLQAATIEATGGARVQGLIEVHQPGAVDDSTLTGRRVSVLGRTGIFQPGSGSGGGEPMLIWQYADNGWVEVGGTFGYHPADGTYDEQQALRVEQRIARALTFGSGDAVTAPFRITAPSGLSLNSVSAADGRTCLTYDAGGTDVAATLTACRIPRGGAVPAHGAGDELVTRALDDGTTLVLIGASTTARSMPPAELAAIADHADVSPRLAEPSSWLPVRQ